MSRPRKDALRNRRLLVVAAKEVIDEDGLNASLDDIARRARLGNATLYRHFPSRDALYEAVFEDLHECVTNIDGRVAQAQSSWDGFVGYLVELVREFAQSRGALEILTEGDRHSDAFDALRSHINSTVQMWTARAQQAGAMRHDVTHNDVLVFLIGIGRLAVAAELDGHSHLWERQLRLMCDGLRETSPSPELPGPTVTDRERDSLMENLKRRR
ncbi:putative TetR family transcriptional regulator [Gordonia effusa NBRC 100432]|uniref:Putative TetR family transcriptional regulator n=1 Tax=Gordonia effusa NBRC 100432 TaxID=1077974 RepID=H0R427_9ACTN|nr:TetR/AcrR family transcriptional regulator [Gordonia effusa]GAB19828.1 putative TetR family transcriptional regulator [Gordonia effusa NBRC 100432]